MTATAHKAIHSLVLDAGPIIRNDPPVSSILSQAESLFTIPEVIDEIRDAATRSRVQTTLLPFLTLRSPKSASIKIITDFARRTGDLEVLSRPDIRLMALAYELECERNHGDWRLRSLPGQKRLNGAPPSTLTGKTLPETPLESEAQALEAASETAPVPSSTTQENDGSQVTFVTTAGTSEPSNEPQTRNFEKSLEATHPSTAGDVSGDRITEPFPVNLESPHRVLDLSRNLVDESDLIVEDRISGSDESDGEGWITPSNLKKHQEKDANGSSEPQDELKTMQVALVTSDFAMQNVLLRMNLNLLSPSLQRIRQLKTWVLRCHACFDITKDMSKQFCNRCGKPTLLRTSCSTDKDGTFKVHLKKNMQWNTRGNVYSIPKPVAGSSNGKLVSGGGKGGWGQELILAEDQKEYIQAMTTARRNKEKDLMDEDYLPNILSGDRGRAGGRPKVGAGKNVNSRKRH